MSDKLDKLRQERDKAERHLRKAANDEKALAHGMELLTSLFHGEAARKKLGMLIGRRRETAGQHSGGTPHKEGKHGNAEGQGKTAYPARCEGRQFLKPKIFASVPFLYLDKTHPNRSSPAKIKAGNAF